MVILQMPHSELMTVVMSQWHCFISSDVTMALFHQLGFHNGTVSSVVMSQWHSGNDDPLFHQ